MLQHAAHCCSLLRTWEGARAIACRAVTAFSCFTTSFTIFSFSCAALYGQYGQYGVNTVSIRCQYVANEFWLVILRRTCLTLRNLKTQTSAFGQAHFWSLHILTMGEAPGWTIGENLPGQLDSFAEKRAHSTALSVSPCTLNRWAWQIKMIRCKRRENQSNDAHSFFQLLRHRPETFWVQLFHLYAIQCHQQVSRLDLVPARNTYESTSPPSTSASIASFHVFHHDHISTYFNTSPLCKGPRAHLANLMQKLSSDTQIPR